MTSDRPSSRQTKPARWPLAVGILLAASLGLILFAAQPTLTGKVSGGFTAPSNTDADGRRHVVKGKDMEQRGNNLLELTEPRVTRYNPDDSPDMVIESSSCFYQTKSGVAYSATNLVVKTTDSRYQIEGLGWKWDLSDSLLNISNQVVAVVQKAALSSAGQTNAGRPASGTIRITSGRFQQEGDAVSFFDHVTVQDGDDTVRCDRLNIAFVKNGGAQKVEALQNVEIRQNDTRVRSGKAIYDVKDNLIRISESPVWSASQREGSSDLLVMNRAENAFDASGHVYMKLPLANLVAASESTATNAPGTNRFVEIRSETFHYDNPLTNRPARAVYSGKVQATQTDATLLCEKLTANFGETNRLTNLHAETGVQITSPGKRLFGNQADYDLDQDKVVVEGAPRWEMNDGKGRGDTVVFFPKRKEMLAVKNVEMLLPGHSLGALFSTNAAPASSGETNAPLKITADSLSHSDKVSVFKDNVLVADSHGTITCSQLSLFSGETNQLQKIIAEKSVVIKQPELAALGDRAEYDQSTGLIRLTGSPELISPGKKLHSDLFIIDRNRNSFSVSPGKFRIQLELDKGRKEPGSK